MEDHEPMRLKPKFFMALALPALWLDCPAAPSDLVWSFPGGNYVFSSPAISAGAMKNFGFSLIGS